MANRMKLVSKSGEIPVLVRFPLPLVRFDLQAGSQPWRVQDIFKNDKIKEEWEKLQAPSGGKMAKMEEEVCSDIGKKKSPIILNPMRFDEGFTEVLKRLWGGDSAHHLVIKIDSASVVLRHPPDFKWLCTWVPVKSQDQRKNFSDVVLKQPFKSLNLGPIKKPYKMIRCPPLHVLDSPGDITGNDQQPRLVARVKHWEKHHDDPVSKGDPIGVFVVADIRMGNITFAKDGSCRVPTKAQFSPDKWETEHADEKYKKFRESLKENLKRCKEIYVQDEDDTAKFINEVKIKAPCNGILTGMLRDEHSRILSFDDVASIDEGDEGWENVLLPVAEWPGP